MWRALVLAVAFFAVVVWVRSTDAPSPVVAVPGWRHQIVTVALSQVGTETDPSNTYCNPYSGYWGAGQADCGSADRSELWCADFAAWTWRRAGVPFQYGFDPGQINAGAVSFYAWAVRHGTWHPVASGYRPEPGDVAVYGLDATRTSVDHVAVVIDAPHGAGGPDVVNGDGDRTAFSVVEIGRDEVDADTSGRPSPLSGYAAPLAPSGSGSGSP